MKRLLIALISVAFLVSCAPGNRGEQAIRDSVAVVDSAPVEPYPDSVLVDTETKGPEKVDGWEYDETKDPMTDKINKTAQLLSSDNSGSIVIRRSPKWGVDAIIVVNSSLIFGPEYYGENYVTVRFDSMPSRKYYFSESGDGNSHVVFINKHSDFIKNCKSAKEILIDIPLYQEGRPIFKYKTDKPLEWK